MSDNSREAVRTLGDLIRDARSLAQWYEDDNLAILAEAKP